MKSDLTFGYYDRAKFTGEMHWVPVQFQYMFGVKLDDVKFAGKSSGLCKEDKPCLITFDSGTTEMSFPSYAEKHVAAMGLPTDTNIVKCKDEKQFGEMALTIGGRDYVLSNSDWMLPPHQPSLVQKGFATESIGPLGPELEMLDSDIAGDELI